MSLVTCPNQCSHRGKCASLRQLAALQEANGVILPPSVYGSNPNAISTWDADTIFGFPRLVTVPTLTTDCEDVLFPPRINKNKQSTQFALMCVWMPDGSCVAAMDQYYQPLGTRLPTNGTFPSCTFDGSLVNLTSVYVLESLPTGTSVMYDSILPSPFTRVVTSSMTNLGIQRLGNELDIDLFDEDKMQLPVLELSLSSNFIGNSAVHLNESESLKTLNLSYNRISRLANMTLPSTLEILNMSGNALKDDLVFPPTPSLEVLYVEYLDGNNISHLYLRFNSTLRYLCVGRNPLVKITATQKMLDRFQHHAHLNDAAVCPYANTTYPALSCTSRLPCNYSLGGLPVSIVRDSAADEALFLATPEDDRLPTLYISLVVFGAAVAIVLASVWMELKRRERRRRDDLDWQSNGSPDNRPTLADSAELLNDIRFDPTYKAYCIPSAAVTRDRLIARGGYGVVYLGSWRAGKGSAAVPVAMKRLLPDRLAHIHNIEDFMDEIRLNSRLSHPNIVTFYGYTWTSLHNLSMVSEFMGRGDLWTLLEQGKQQQADLPWNISPAFRLNWSVESTPKPPPVLPTETKSEGLVDSTCEVSKERLLRDVVQALVYLHSQDIIHRDLKAKNVMLGVSNEAKLTDFGTSRECLTSVTMTAEIGTVAWIAPEILKGVRYSAKADMYSLGVVLSEMDTLQVPYSNSNQPVYGSPKALDVAKTRIALLVVSGDLKPEFTPTCPPCIFVIAQRCLAYNPDDRPTAAEVLSWLNQLRLPVMS
ncbi:hypothetical protein DYB36_000532 [Aphanomyces astaci]|uniref:Protein kinase domain-containing protein n=2 Tax=Aphanomyces astaci TaxID=112090 RepID=A0A397ASS9_APHAT|nr:hypothetical protein DYB36_000532 [Aphanomyces astaci]